MAVAIAISGPIASGKSTVASALHARIAGSVLIEGDDHGAPPGLSLQARWTYALWRLSQRLQAALAGGGDAIVAWPLSPAYHAYLQDVANGADGHLICVTLCPPIDVTLSGRGRALTAWECNRIRAMYDEGYAAWPFSDLMLDSAALDPTDCVDRILRYLAAG